MSGERQALRVYRALVRLYPQEFRDEYGADMVELVRNQCVDESTWQVFSRAAVDLAITIPAQHLEAHMNRPSTHIVPLLYTALACGGVLFALVGGSDTRVIAFGLVIAIITGTMAGIAWRRAGPVGERISTRGWWKLVIAGPCILIAVVIAANLGVDAWIVGMFAVLVAFVATGIGVLLGVVRLVKHRLRAIPT